MPLIYGLVASATSSLSRLIAFIRNFLQKRTEFLRPLYSSFKVHLNLRVRILTPVTHNSMPDRLIYRVAVRKSALLLVSDATVEVVAVACFSPKRSQPGGQLIVH